MENIFKSIDGKKYFLVSFFSFLFTIVVGLLIIVHNRNNKDLLITPLPTQYIVNTDVLQHGNINVSFQTNEDKEWIEDNPQDFQKEKKEAYEYYELGNKYAAEKEYKKALEYYDMAIKNNYAVLSDAYYKRGNINYNKGLFDEAISDYNSVLSYSITLKAVIYNAIANAYFLKKDYANAYDFYKKAIDDDPAYISAWYNLGNINIILDNHDEALDNFNTALNQAMSTTFKEKYLANLFYARGVELYNRQDYINAIDDFKKTIDLKSEYENAYVDLGNAYIRLKDFEGAITTFNNVLNINPNNLNALNNRAYAYSSIGENTKASKDIEQFNSIKKSLGQ
ncbi:hypothetical protein FACS189485_21510 [Spirochaetia bacterium]|nr:hypothetical protein FACS189485_21510 [Spirochaetia bacterium]